MNAEQQPHGWVVPRPDGVKARCGGPAICRACQAEQDALASAPAQRVQFAGPEPAADVDRARFEAFFASRKSKGVAHRERMFDKLADGSYVDDGVQRHWWTWQNALRGVGVAHG